MIFCFECSYIEDYKMNEILNKFLLAGDKFMPEMHLNQPGFTYSNCGPFTTKKERIQIHGYQRGLASLVYNFFDKKSAGSGVNMHANNEHLLNLAEELHKPIIRKF